MYSVQNRERLSAPALETLAIISYKQPITKSEIEGIRGVNVDYIVNSLVDRGLIKIVGKKDVIGKPFLFGTTVSFLEHFGLANLDDLPGINHLRFKEKVGGKNEQRTQEVTNKD